MMERLTQLELNNWRGFLGTHSVPLDADVVLFFGENGVGKTSLFYAIEMAMLGRVGELAKFERDYPRCLVHVGADSSEVSLKYAHGGSETIRTYFVDSDDIRPRAPELPSKLSRYVRERAFLPQSSLAGLLDHYQTPEGSLKSGEQPIVRVMRELLGLDVVSALTDGLFVAKHVSRLRKRLPELERFEERGSELKDKRVEIQAELQEAHKEHNELASAWWQEFAKLDPAPEQGLSHDGVLKRLELLQRDALGISESELSYMLEELAQNPSIATIDRAAIADEELIIESIRRRLDNASATWEKVRTKILEETREFLTASEENWIASASPSEHSELVARLKRLLESSVVDYARLDETKDNRAALEEELTAEGETAEKTVENMDASRSGRLAELLSEMRVLIDGERCPVCDRDFSEVSTQSLDKHIEMEIGRLGADANRLAEQKKVAAERLATRRAKEDRLNELVQYEKRLEQTLAESQRKYAVIEKCVTELTSIVDTVTAFIEADIELRNRLHWLDQQKALVGRRDAIVSRLAPYQEQGFEEELEASIKTLAERVRNSAAMVNRLHELESVLSKIGDLEDRMAGLDAHLEDHGKRSSEVEQARKKMRELATAAESAKRHALDLVFNEQLNELWADLFLRLAKEETFKPSLKSLEPVRGAMRAALQAVTGDGKSFDQIGAVLSSGNVNTAALSLFLTLNLLEEPQAPILLLDDPVQSMDDLHVVEFAATLKDIVQHGRQVLVGVHEEQLFEFLCNELGPTHEKQSLLAIRIERSGESAHTRSDFREWTPDQVQFTG